jgi:uncharacterized HAD superfamily protein
MKLGFDIDGVVARMDIALVAAMNEEFGLNYGPEIFVHHNLFKNTYVEDEKLNEEIAQFMRKNVIYDKKVVANLEPYEDAAIAIRQFNRQHTIHFITGRPVEQQDTCVSWLRANNIPFTSVHAIGRADKGMVGRSLNLDFYIDDELKHLESMYKYKNRWRKGLALYRQPWNLKNQVDLSKYLTFDNWKDIIRHLGIHNR